MKKIKGHPVLSSLLIAEMISVLIAVLHCENLMELPEMILLATILSIFVCYPFVLTIINVLFTVMKVTDREWQQLGKLFENITLLLGLLYTCLFAQLSEIKFSEDWMITLRNNEQHTPIFTETYPTIIIIALSAVGGYLFLSWRPLKKMSPILIVTSIAAMYLGIIECILWMIQIWSLEGLFLILLPLNFVIIAIKVIRRKIEEWYQIQYEENRFYKYLLFNRINQKLTDAKHWPIVAFLLMWPLLGILICIFVLFGQEPDAVIKAWTETSDWNLSQRIAPQNVHFDEHYLCTVAAGGHRKIVKPLRLGRRHGHEVIVNRQLCVANAFEQILEEKVPRVHGPIRRSYDNYGFPIAKLIRSPYIADLIYVAMKPLEWLFLIAIYACDTRPEDRIAIQYTGVTKEQVLGK